MSDAARATHRIYYTDATVLTFDARVVDRTDGGRRVYLDTTAFYPTSGGQPHDTGVLGGVRVIDVIDEGDRIAHLLDAPLPSAESRVACSVDARRRRDHMQQHTGQHLLSAVLEDLFGWRTESVHFGADQSTLDVDAGSESATTERLQQAEERANELVAANRPVLVTFEQASEAQGLRKPSEREGEIRVVEIGGVDRSACGGTHVRSTAEIGPVVVAGVERVRGRARIAFLCGDRIIARAKADRHALEMIASSLGCAVAEAPMMAAKAAGELKEAGAETRAALAALKAAATELAAYRLERLRAAAEADSRGVRWLILRPSQPSPVLPTGLTADDLRALAQAAAACEQTVLIGAAAAQPLVVAAASADTGLDVASVLRQVLAEHGGRGGGSARVAQGSLPAGADPAPVLDLLRSRLGAD